MEEATKAMSKMLGWQDAEKALHLYLYAKYMPHYLYALAGPVGLVQKPPEEEIPPEIQEMIDIVVQKVMREMGSRETSTYHGKIVPTRLAEDLVRVEEDIELRDLEKVIPYKVARDIVLQNPQSIAVVDCGCRMLQNEPCEPLGVCLAVGDPFATFVIENRIQNARGISSDEAVEIIRAEHERGHVHGAYFKDVVGGRFYAICNCCACCCMGMQAWLKLGTPIIAPSGFVARVNEECTACGECAETCPFAAITVEEAAVVDEAKCMGCGVCEGACELDAISLELEPSKGEPLDINRLISEKGAGGS